MNSVRKAVREYLTLRRALGFELRLAGQMLLSFADYTERMGATHITTDLAVRWAALPTQAQPAQWANRLGVVRRFAQYRAASDPRTDIPPQGTSAAPYQ